MSETSWPRIVAHADMDAFYAAVEQLDHPELRGRPVLVGPRGERGVVLTASYEARPFGVGSAMPVVRARRLCPEAVTVPPRFDRYEEISRTIMRVFGDFSPCVEPLSLDEAFIELSGAERIFGSPAEMGRRIGDAVREATGLTASVGVSGTKYVAKAASSYRKPDGLTVVPPWEARAWLAPQPVSRLFGAGPKTLPKLAALGLHTIGDVARCDPRTLHRGLGSLGAHLAALANARDPRPVEGGRTSRSVGSDRTLLADVSARGEILPHLRDAADRIGRRLRRKGCAARGVRVRLKTARFEMLTRQCVLARATDVADILYEAAGRLLDAFGSSGPFRLVGMAAYDLCPAGSPEQLQLFDRPFDREGRIRRLERTLDALIERFGRDVVGRARDLGRDRTLGGRDAGSNLDFLSVARVTQRPPLASDAAHHPL